MALHISSNHPQLWRKCKTNECACHHTRVKLCRVPAVSDKQRGSNGAPRRYLTTFPQTVNLEIFDSSSTPALQLHRKAQQQSECQSVSVLPRSHMIVIKNDRVSISVTRPIRQLNFPGRLQSALSDRGIVFASYITTIRSDFQVSYLKKTDHHATLYCNPDFHVHGLSHLLS